MRGFTILMILFAFVSFADILIAAKSFQEQKLEGKNLGWTCLGAFVVTASYTIGLFVQNYFAYSVLASIYFGGIDLTLLALLGFTRQYTTGEHPKGLDVFFQIVRIWVLLDCLLLIVNPLCEVSISYVATGTSIAPYRYDMHLPYYLHLVLSYLMVATVLFLLVRMSMRAPQIYRSQYLYCVITILAVVGLNAIYLYMPGLFGREDIDYSLLGYSIAAVLLYWSSFQYSTHGLLTHFHSWIFENIDQALVLFDYNDKLILHNQKADEMLSSELFSNQLFLADFLKHCGIKRGKETDGTHYSFQCFIKGTPMRCDYSAQMDKKGRRQGRLFVFSPVTTQYDLLTGFRSWLDFKQNVDTLFTENGRNVVVATLDINSLTDINRKYGRTIGDRSIQRLADEMRSVFPPEAVFTRSREASLAVVCEDSSIEAMQQYVREIEKHLQSSDLFDGPIQIQSSITEKGEEHVLDAIRRCLQAMRTKKLMDRTSVHSEMLRSLLQALTQCDSDTGAHVQRTQRSGEALGKRIGLTDQQQSNLALLAILHDIGKIGIPLEILNKPGKLTDSEWKMLKTHTEKGYQIAISSQELSGIADMILYHHERWDGRGYPKGLREEQIPLLSRIIAVVDAYDAMTNDRAYRKALSESAARSELRRCAGTQFDPIIVREFLAMLEENDQKQGITVSTMSEMESAADPAPAAAAPVQKERRNVHIMAYSTYVIGGGYRIVQADENFERITGYTLQDVSEGKLTQMSLIFEEDRKEYLDQVQTLMPRGTDVYLQHRLRRKDGTAIFVYCYGHSFYDSAEGEERTRIVIINSDDPFAN